MANQSSKYDFPVDVIEEIRCTYCNNYVSCGPVKVKANGGTICGRCSCSSSSGDGAVRHILFETVMSKFNFPCRYKAQGCEKRFAYGDVEHENACPYRTFACPVLPYGICMENLSVFDIYQHFEKAHGNLIVKNGRFKLDLQKDSQCNLLLNKEDVGIVQYDYDVTKQILYLNVAFFSNSNQASSYKLQIASGADSDHIIGFKQHPCRRYEGPTISLDHSRNLFLGNYIPALENPSFVFLGVNLERNRSSSGNQLQQDTLQANLLSSNEQKTVETWDLLEHVRCFHCNCFSYLTYYKEMVPFTRQIRTCCYNCKESLNITASPNTDPLPNFPCQWRGCSYVGTIGDAREHVKQCSFRTITCPILSCAEGYFTQSTAAEHIAQHGAEYCPNPERIIIELFNNDDFSDEEYYTRFNDDLIGFTFEMTKTKYNNFSWQLLEGNNSNFAMDIHFEHSHCSFKTKTFSYVGTAPKTVICDSTTYADKYPSCFKFGKRIWVVLKLKQKFAGN